MAYAHERDMVGYGETPPHPQWPNGARVAVSFVLNYEEGGEYAFDNGDNISETYLAEIVGLQPQPGCRFVASESIYDFGSRVGGWRIKRLFDERKMPMTVYAVGQAVEKNPDFIRAMHDSGHEIASHHYRWIDYSAMAIDDERAHLKKAISAIEKVTGERPVGIYGGRTSLNTRRLVAEDGGFLYESDAYNDELPYWEHVDGHDQLIVPYMLDNNDFKYATLPSWGGPEAFFDHNKATFDMLYREGTTAPKMMSVGLHCRLSGRPGRAEILARFLDYVASHDNVWVCTRRQIAEHWHQNFPTVSS
ncbi:MULTISPECIES: allantoinase PuuE [Kordiimonas]|jgi:putative urate catabolism protein|uniref:allantoinase PuuE n=1 Tax=Kordiimonas TaxID=288021 RepID=UPI00257A44D5|nr:allantoinase PuuE [Kordiimonas sp. UBA4487]